jgi:hypothetical protein
MKCIKCEITAKDKVILPGLHFSFLKGNPVLCDKCLYKILTGEDIPWSEKAEREYIKEGGK